MNQSRCALSLSKKQNGSQAKKQEQGDWTCSKVGRRPPERRVVSLQNTRKTGSQTNGSCAQPGTLQVGVPCLLHFKSSTHWPYDSYGYYDGIRASSAPFVTEQFNPNMLLQPVIILCFLLRCDRETAHQLA